MKIKDLTLKVISRMKNSLLVDSRLIFWLYNLIISSLLSIICILKMLPVSLFDPFDADWLMGKDLGALDLAQSNTAQNSFLSQNWKWPLYELSNLGSEFKTSLIFNDAIPILSYLLKITNSIFQYHTSVMQFAGLTVFLSLFLLSICVIYLIYKASFSLTLATITAATLIFHPILWTRVFAPSLMFQFIIVICIYLIVVKPQIRKDSSSSWYALGLLASLIHSYFVPMITIFFISNFLLFKESNKKSYKQILIFFIIVIVGTYFSGGFSAGFSGPTTAKESITKFSADLFSPINSMGLSGFFPAIFTLSSYEGYSYPGIAAFILIILTFLMRQIKKKSQDGNQSVKYDKPMLTVVFAVIFLFLLAVGPTLSIWGDRHLVTENQILLSPFTVFKTSGRFAICIVYAAILLPTILMVRYMNVRVSILIAIIIFSIQFIEFKDFYHGTKIRMEKIVADSPRKLNAQLEKRLSKNVIISYIPSGPSPDIAPWRELVIPALALNSNSEVTNFAYMNRYSVKRVIKEAISTTVDVNNGSLDSKRIYVVESKELEKITQEFRILDVISNWFVIEVVP